MFDLTAENILDLRSIEDQQCDGVQTLIDLAIGAVAFGEVYSYDAIGSHEELREIALLINNEDRSNFYGDLVDVGDHTLAEKFTQFVQWVVEAHC